MGKELALAEVWMWERLVGAVAEQADGRIVFEYDPGFRSSGLEISPIKLPLSTAGPVSFPELNRIDTFSGLPGALADALPDRFGNAVIRSYFSRRGTPELALSPVQKLLYLGSRALGALEFRPAKRVEIYARGRPTIDVGVLVEHARRIVEGKIDVAIPEIMQLSASAGGARAKAVVLFNPQTQTIRSSFAAAQKGDEHWLVKFDGVGELGSPDYEPRGFTRIEYVYGLMAGHAGIEVAPSVLYEKQGLAHLFTKRFDRTAAGRVHMHSLGGLTHTDFNQPGGYSYEEYLRMILALNLGYPALEEGFRRAVFNILAANQDDHVKNFAFLMKRNGTWGLAPAYDLTHANGSTAYTRTHQLTLGEKSSGFTAEDLLALGERFGVKNRGAGVIEQVSEALTKWPALAREFGVPQAKIEEISKDLAARNHAHPVFVAPGEQVAPQQLASLDTEGQRPGASEELPRATMHEHNLNHQKFTLAGIDDLIGRGKRADWAQLRREVLADRTMLEKVRRVCKGRLEDPGAQRYHFWNHYAERHLG